MEDKKTSRLYRVIRWLVWLFSPKYRLVGTENLPADPCVFAGNHSQMYGPIAAELYTPGPHYVWCVGEMMHADEVADYAYRDFWSMKPPWIRWFYRLLSRLIPPLSVLIFTSAHTIPVYHDARVLTTFRESVARLREGASLVIFPEHYTEHNHIVHDFQERFVDVARFYHKKTGKELSFVPMYTAPRLKMICYGRPIAFHADAPIAEERTRICRALMDAVTELAEALPEHTVVPYPNVSKREYPKNIAPEDRHVEKTEV